MSRSNAAGIILTAILVAIFTLHMSGIMPFHTY